VIARASETPLALTALALEIVVIMGFLGPSGRGEIIARYRGVKPVT
jgi:hypothetical protein